jgi:serine/threonine protein kinase
MHAVTCAKSSVCNVFVLTMYKQVLKGEYTEKADLWSVGCMTFHLIAGIPAFECETEAETIKKLMSVSYTWPKGVTVSSEAKEFVYNLLKFNPKSRMTAQVSTVLLSTRIMSTCNTQH